MGLGQHFDHRKPKYERCKSEYDFLFSSLFFRFKSKTMSDTPIRRCEVLRPISHDMSYKITPQI